MNGIIEMPNMKDRKENIASAKKKQENAEKKGKRMTKTKEEEKLYKQLAKNSHQLLVQRNFRMNVTWASLILAKQVFEKECATTDERDAAICILATMTNINGMPCLSYCTQPWMTVFNGTSPLYQFNYVFYRYDDDGLDGIEEKGYNITVTKEKLKKDMHFLRLKRVNNPGKKKVRYVRTVTIFVPVLLKDDELWDNFRKRVVFNTNGLTGLITTVSFNEDEIDLPVLSPIGADFDGGKLYPAVYDEVPANTENEDQAVNAADDNGLFNKMNETISYLNSLSELEGWSAWHGTEYRRTDSKDHTAVIVPDKLSGVGTATWYELFYPGYKKLKHVDLIRRHVEAVLKDKYDYTISYPTKTEIEDEIFEADAHAWISHPDTEKCGFAYTKYGNVTHFRKNMKLAIFPMITITEKSDNT